MKAKTTKKHIYSLLVIFMLIVIYFSIPFDYLNIREPFFIFAMLGLAFLVLGILIITRARKTKEKEEINYSVTSHRILSYSLFISAANASLSTTSKFSSFRSRAFFVGL